MLRCECEGALEDWRERLGQEIRAKGPGFKVTEFSESLGFSRDFVSRMLKPDSNPTIKNLQKVCDGLGVSFVYIFSGVRTAPVYDQIAQKMAEMSEGELIELRDHLKSKEVKRFGGPN